MIESFDPAFLEQEKAPRKLPSHSQMMLPIAVSSNPGAWFTESYTFAILSEEEGEHLHSMKAILDSYDGLRLRYRKLLLPIDGDAEFEVRENQLETKSICFGEPMDIEQLRADTAGKGFTMAGTKGVLSPVKIRKWSTDRNAELEGYKPAKKKGDRKKSPATKKQKEDVKPLHTRVSPDELCEAYAVWFLDRGSENRDTLWLTLNNFLMPKALRLNGPLKKQDEHLSSLHDFLIHFMSKLEQNCLGEGTVGEVETGQIQKFDHYVNRAWNRERIRYSNRLKRNNKRSPEIDSSPKDSGEPSDDEQHVVLQRDDQYVYNQHRVDIRNPDELHGPVIERERAAERLAKLNKLTPDQRDLVGFYLQNKTQTEIANLLNLRGDPNPPVSQQWVGRQLRKIGATLQSMHTAGASL